MVLVAPFREWSYSDIDRESAGHELPIATCAPFELFLFSEVFKMAEHT